MKLTATQKKNFRDKVEKTSTCWKWIGSKNNGYGRLNLNGKVYLAHRISFLIHGGKISPLKKSLGAKGKIVMHTCDNRCCVNPKHLVLTTQMINMRDAKTKGRKWNKEQQGTKNPKAKLTESIVLQLKQLFNTGINVRISDLAKSLGVDRTQLYLIKQGKSWKHVTL